jgi:hypothetical protein
MKFLKYKKVLLIAITTLVVLSNVVKSQLFDFIQKKDEKKDASAQTRSSIFGSANLRERKSAPGLGSNSIFSSTTKKSLFNNFNDHMMNFKETGTVNNQNNDKNSSQNISNESNKIQKKSEVKNDSDMEKLKHDNSKKINSSNKATSNLENSNKSNKKIKNKNENKSINKDHNTKNISKQNSISSETQKLSKQIQNKKNQITEIDRQQSKMVESQRKELLDLEKKYKEINEKTRKLQKLFSESHALKEHRETTKKLQTTEAEWDKYIDDISKVNLGIENLKKEIDELVISLEKHRNSTYIENLIVSTPIQNTDIENNLNIKGDMKTTNLLAQELKLSNKVKLTDNVIEVPSNYVINYMGTIFPFQELIYYNSMAEMLRKNCGENLNCFVTKEEDKDRQKKEEIIDRTIESIRSHLEALKN